MTNFFMVPNEVFDLNLKPQQFAVLCYILKCCDESNTCYPSIHTIAEACAISDNTVRESIKFLCKRKIITKSGRLRVVLRCRILFVISFVQNSFPAPPSARSFVQSCSAAACRCARLESLRST